MSMKFRRFLCFLTALLLISGCAGKEDGKKYPSEYEPSPSPKMSELRLPSSPGEQVAVDSSGLVQIDYSNTSSGYLQAKLCTSLKKGCASR